MLKLIRWIFGYVLFEAKGSYPERFMNLTSKYGICIWNVKKTHGMLSAYIAASQYKCLRYSARKSELRLKVKQRYGLPFYLRKLKPRLGIVVGIVVFFAILYIMSLFVWQIDIEGIENLNEAQIIHTMESLGLYEGRLKNSIDIRVLEQNAMENIENISWISVNIRGSIATISIKERITPPEIVSKDKPCNIKAKCDGQICRMEVYDGTAEVNVGDAVFKGQLLVNAIVDDIYGGYTVHHADGKIFAYTKRKIVEEVPLNQTVYNETGNMITRESIKIFGTNIPVKFTFKPNGNYKNEYSKHRLSFFDLTLPITVYKQIFIEQNEEEIILTKDEAKNKAESKIKEDEEKNLSDITIIDRIVKERIYNNTYICEVAYYCEENIAMQEEVMVN